MDIECKNVVKVDMGDHHLRPISVHFKTLDKFENVKAHIIKIDII